MSAKSPKNCKGEIRITKFSADIANSSPLKAYYLPPEVLVEALGGISTLYLEAFLRTRADPYLTVKTTHAFASKHVTLGKILREISNCTGADATMSRSILQGMEDALRDNFYRRGITGPGQPLAFKPLGFLEAVNLDKSSYLLHCRDPAADNYSSFLFSRKK